MSRPELPTYKAVEYVKCKGKLITFDPNLRGPRWKDFEDAKVQLIRGLSQADVVKISHVVDTIGAGDIFGGSAAWKLLQYGIDPAIVDETILRDVATFACTSAGLSAIKSGGISSVPDYDDVCKLIVQQ